MCKFPYHNLTILTFPSYSRLWLEFITHFNTKYDFSIILNSLCHFATLRRPIKCVYHWLLHADVTKEKSYPKEAISINNSSSLYASLSFLVWFYVSLCLLATLRKSSQANQTRLLLDFTC